MATYCQVRARRAFTDTSGHWWTVPRACVSQRRNVPWLERREPSSTSRTSAAFASSRCGTKFARTRCPTSRQPNEHEEIRNDCEEHHLPLVRQERSRCGALLRGDLPEQ